MQSYAARVLALLVFSVIGCAGVPTLTEGRPSSIEGQPSPRGGPSRARPSGEPMIVFGDDLSAQICRRPSTMATNVDKARALRSCRQLKAVQHVLGTLLKEESFLAKAGDLGDRDTPDLDDPVKRRQYFFGRYWSTYVEDERLTQKQRIDGFEAELRVTFARLMAVLIASTNPTDRDDAKTDWLWELPAVYQQERDLEARAVMMREDVNGWIQNSGLWMFANVGTKDIVLEDIAHKGGNETVRGDMDFILANLIQFLYAFRDRKDLLTDSSVVALLHKDWPNHDIELPTPVGWEKTNIPVSGQDFEPALLFWAKHRRRKRGKSFAETENHVLMTLAHYYLVNQWITEDYRGNMQAFAEPPDDFPWTVDTWWAYEGVEIEQAVRDALGRVIHSGMFEFNGRSYQQYSYAAILALATFAENDVVRAEAENALHYLATKFAFQSLDGRRWAPMRRNCQYVERMTMYENDGLAASLGVLSGAYKWNDSPYGLKPTTSDPNACFTGLVPDCHWPSYSWKRDVQNDDSISERIAADGRELSDDFISNLNPQNIALFTAFSSYEIPRAVHDFMLHQRDFYFARMMPRYDRTHYPLLRFPAKPRYFDGDEAHGSRWINSERTPEFYFSGHGFLNVAGGVYNSFYFDREVKYVVPRAHQAYCPGAGAIKKNSAISPYDSLTRPYTVLPQVPATIDAETGAVLFYRPFGIKGVYPLSDAEKTLPLMLGNSNGHYKSANLATYKNFSYGYRTHWTHRVAGNRYYRSYENLGGESPQVLPLDWHADVPQAKFKIGAAQFVIFDLREMMKREGQAGYLLVTASVNKHLTREWSKKVARGFWEVVPGSLFEGKDVNDVKSAIQELNGPDNFKFGHRRANKDFYYRMLTTRELLRLDQQYGTLLFYSRRKTRTSHEGRIQGITGVTGADGRDVELKDTFVEFLQTSHTNTLPLIDVKAARQDYTFLTDPDGAFVYLACAEDGWLCVNNRSDGSYLWVDSRRGSDLGDKPTWESGSLDDPSSWKCSCTLAGGKRTWIPGPPADGTPQSRG